MTLNDFMEFTIAITNRLRIEVVLDDETITAYRDDWFECVCDESEAWLEVVVEQYGDRTVIDLWHDDDTFETVLMVAA